MSLIFIFVITLAATSLNLFFSPPPFIITSDMNPSTYGKRMYPIQKDRAGAIFYSDSAKTMLDNIPEDELLDFRCTDSFVRTVQGAYILEHTKTKDFGKKQVKNFDFKEFMRSKEPDLPKGKRILSVRVCELEDKTLVLLYSIGEYESKGADSQNPRQVILNSSKNRALIQVLPFGKPGPGDDVLISSESHTRCDNVFGISKNGTMYLLCEEKDNFLSEFSVYGADVRNKTVKILAVCLNDYENGIESFCY